ncbi:sulfatase [Halobellus sp. MBLA0160]|uniref:Sulfatase n=2 Tax=Halobellus ruber TaxID=2761102 RepID=A0A7J9SIQ5_9EURY|nr:sulfatase [Halobellus ruber]
MEEKSNVVLVVMDTARADFVDTQYAEKPVTPNISEIAEEGSSFSSVYSTAPWTLPSHASLLTGTYPSTHCAHAGHKLLDSEHTMLQEVLAGSGYETVGVSNNVWVGPSFGFESGFEKFIKGWELLQSGTDLGGIGLTTNGREQIISIAKNIFRGNPFKNFINAVFARYYMDRELDNGAHRTNRRINSWLGSREDSKPFFLFINYLEPHLEYRPPKEYAKKFLPETVSYQQAMNVNQNAWEYVTEQVDHSKKDFKILKSLYAAETAYLDSKIGDLIAILKENDEWDETVFILLGDHGENIGEHNLMDHQYCLYDTLMNVPLVTNKEQFGDSVKSDELIQLVDIAPTILDEVDIGAHNFRDQIQGYSLHNSDFGRKFVIGEYAAPQPSRDAIEERVGDPHGIMDRFDRSIRCIRNNEFKYIRGSDGETELYNIKSDPGESQNVSNEYPEMCEQLEQQLDHWLDSINKRNVSGEVSMGKSTQQRLEDLGYLQ